MRTVIISPSGGLGALLADLTAGSLLELPPVSVALPDRPAISGNPVDIGPIALLDELVRLEYVSAIIESDTRPDAIVLALTPLVSRFDEIGTQLIEVIPRWTASGVAVVVTYMASDARLDPDDERALRSAGAAVIARPENAVAALAVLAAARNWSGGDLPPAPSPRDPSGTIPEDGFALIQQHGLSIPEQSVAESVSDADEIGARLGFPLVVKIESEAIPHRTQLGGVIIGLRDTAELAQAIAVLHERFGSYLSDGRAQILVQRQLEGEELLIGIVTDIEFGPVLTVGFGGITAELEQDVAFLPLPCNSSQVEAALLGLRKGALFQGYRNLPPLDLSSVVGAVAALIDAYAAEPAVSELEVNPLIVVGNRSYAVDVLLA